ncbi:MAG TPA: serine/threonine-protein kinase, partial [Steroidobacteraceae bacterium]|nr:serine/threonine-protein kinase [Steroidobacteraceae bacterium]
RQAAGQLDLELQNRLDELACGECSEEEFVDEISSLLRAAPSAAWQILIGIHQRYLHVERSGDSLRAKAMKSAARERERGAYGTTIDLQPTLELATRGNSDQRSTPTVGSTETIEIGRVLRERYVLKERLGSGGMGTVFKALDRYRADLPQANQYVAIKILHTNTDNRLELLENLRREFYCTQMLSHRNIVKVYELDRDGDIDFFTMELLEGELLSSVTERLHPLPMSRPYAWAIIREIGSGLAHAHARNVIHTDLKPQNIMITNSGEVRILDFGASSHPATPGAEILARRNALSAVTPAYACCELLAGRPADPRDDIYAFACIAYELLAGSHPFQRRPSTIARDLGIVPTRPPDLSGQQWKTLTMGLSWHRAARSIGVNAWLNKLHAERAAAMRLPRALDLKPAPPAPRPAAPFRAAAVFAVLLITVAVWASFVRVAPGRRVAGDHIVPAVAATVQRSPDATAASGPGDGGTMAAATVPVETLPQAQESHSPPSSSVKHEAGRTKMQAALLKPIIVTAGNYKIRSGENFAEIRVHRSPQGRSDTAFVWWTEPASAKPGIDYVHQAKVTQLFPKGKNSTSFFIKLVPKPSRTQREMFYVAIAAAGPGASPGPIERAAIWLPGTDDHS